MSPYNRTIPETSVFPRALIRALLLVSYFSQFTERNSPPLSRTTLKLSIRTTMATARALLLRPHQTLTLIQTHLLRSLSTSPPNHQFLSANDFLNSWTPHTDPKRAEAELALLRREYAKKVKAYRKEYIEEVELERIEKQRKDEAKREAMRIANEERRAAKVASKKAKAAEREVAEEEFRQTLVCHSGLLPVVGYFFWVMLFLATVS